MSRMFRCCQNTENTEISSTSSRTDAVRRMSLLVPDFFFFFFYGSPNWRFEMLHRRSEPKSRTTFSPLQCPVPIIFLSVNITVSLLSALRRVPSPRCLWHFHVSVFTFLFSRFCLHFSVFTFLFSLFWFHFSDFLFLISVSCFRCCSCVFFFFFQWLAGTSFPQPLDWLCFPSRSTISTRSLMRP